MRLKEIEARLAEIKEELNTRAAELTDEEITKLETEVTDLQEERTALLAAAEKRKKLLERIAAGEPTGGAGADTTLLRNFKGAGGAGAGEPEDKYDTTAYRKAFMNYVCRGVAIPAEYRAAETTTTADSGAVIPTTIMNEIIQKLESYGSIYAKVRKINVQGGVSIPIADLKPTAHWITEAKSSDDQKAPAKNSVTFNYYGLECKISQSILANVVTLKMFTDLFVPMATEAMVKAIEIAIFNGTGEGQPLGVLKDRRVTAVIRAYAYRFTPQKRGVSMGEFNTVGLEDIIDAFSRREAATVEAVPKMLKAGADVLIEAQRAEAQAMGLNETGGFINSIKATGVKGDDTEKYVEIYPQGRAKHGNDRKGDKSKVRYATIGFVAEYGTSSHAARPYMTVANEKAHEKVVEAQRSIWESETGE